MLTVGLTGGLASGKTFIASCFQEFGAHVIHADKLGHEALARDGEAYDEVIAAFGGGILNEHGSINRAALGAIVFNDPEQLERLNNIIHPHIFHRQEGFFQQIAEIEPHGIAVVEAAIMIEIGSYKRYDRIVLADCPLETQIERFMSRDNATREQALARIDRQMPLEEKRPYADHIIDTTGSFDETRERTRTVYVKLREEALS
jgi:dephospho-CoA kinase